MSILTNNIVIRWHLHACIEIIYEGKSLLIDPHDGGSLGAGFHPPRADPDYILVTHDHYDHNAVELFTSQKRVEVVRERVGVFELLPFKVKGVKLPHDEFNGRIRGHVVAYRIEAGDMTLVHLSDLGRPLKENEAKELASADIVFVPAGGVYTLHPKQALEVAESLGAKILVPIHYWIPGIQLPLDPLDTLLRYAKKWRIIRHESNEIELSKELLPERPTILVLAAKV